MSKAVILSDLHAHPWPDFSATRPFKGGVINTRVYDAVRVLRHVRAYVEEHKPDYFIYAGDLFHRKRLIDISVYNSIAAEVWAIGRLVESYYIPGNHDLARKGLWSNEHALYALSRKHVHIISEPTLVGSIGLVPFADDRAGLLKGIEALNGEPECYVLHAGVNGAVTGAIEHMPRELVKVDDLPFVPIYSGHYHLPQEVTRARGSSVVYIGAPLELIRGEGSRIQRGFIEVDLDDPTTYIRLSHKGPRFKRVEDWQPGTEYKHLKGNFVDVTYDTTKTNVLTVEQEVQAHEVRGCRIVPMPQRFEHKSRLKVKTKRGQLPSLQKLCSQYVEEFAPDDLDAEVLKGIAREALDEAGSKA